MADPNLEKRLKGLYKSNNVLLHDFRRPVGKILPADDSEFSNLLNNKSHQNTSLAALNIMKPADFNVLKGHIVDRERATQS